MAYPCEGCNFPRLGIFFDYPEIRPYILAHATRAQPPPVRCLGCKITAYLNSETDHYKIQKRSIVRSWLDNEDHSINENNLPKFVADFVRNDVKGQARTLDDTNQRHIEQYGYSKETLETQKPMSDKVKRANRGDFTASPKVGEWQSELYLRKQKERDPESAKWNWYRADRYQGHVKYNT
jgi:hypothetical protein